MKAKIVAFDLDGTLTEETPDADDLPGSYSHAKPNIDTIQLCEAAYNRGWVVVIFTGRDHEYRRMTENWLFAYKVRYHYLFMGKPYYTVIIDDKAKTAADFRELLRDPPLTVIDEVTDIPPGAYIDGDIRGREGTS